MVIHLPLGLELETLWDLSFKVTCTLGWQGQLERKDLSPRTSQTSLGMISCFIKPWQGVWKGDAGAGFSFSPSLQLWLWEDALFNSKAEEDKSCDPKFKPSGKLCDPACDRCQLWDGANPLHLT